MITYRDISHYDYDRGDRGEQIAHQPLVIAKATEGTDFTDPRYGYWRDQAKAYGVPFAAYHYLRTSDVNAQAKHAFAMVGSDTPLMIDVESGSGNLGNILAFASAYRSIGGRVTLVYLPHWYWQQIGSPNLKPLADAKLALVSSNYPSRGYTEDGPGWDSYGGVSPAIWQYTSKPYDTNAYRGSAAELLALVGITDKPTTPTIPTATDRKDSLLTNWKTVSRYSTNRHSTLVVQGLLLAAGYGVGSRSGRPDGDWGPVTDKAVRDFQVHNRVPNSVSGGKGDGQVGTHTMSYLLYGRDVA